MILARLLIALLAMSQLGAAPSAMSLHVDLSERSMDVRVNGKTVETYPVGIGTKSHPTPTGSFLIRRVIWNPKWVPPRARWALRKRATPPGDPKNPMKVVKIFFKVPDYYIHGTGDELSVGDVGSHGCLRMTPSDVRRLGEMVMEYGGQPREETWYGRVLSTRKEAPVRLKNAIPIQVKP